jgi:hypothetical protein
MSHHLDAARWRALQQKPDPALLAHLEEGCERCDEFLGTVPGYEGLDGEVDRALLALTPRSASTDELAWARWRRRQRAPRRALAAAAAMTALSAAAWAFWPAPQPVTSGLKGSGRAQLELRAALKSSEGSLAPVDDGARVPASAALVFQVRSSFAGPARFFVQRGEAAPVELAQFQVVEGAQELEAERGLLGFSLSGERGPLQLWLVACEFPFSSEDALRAIATGEAPHPVAHLRVEVVE